MTVGKQLDKFCGLRITYSVHEHWERVLHRLRAGSSFSKALILPTTIVCRGHEVSSQGQSQSPSIPRSRLGLPSQSTSPSEELSFPFNQMLSRSGRLWPSAHTLVSGLFLMFSTTRSSFGHVFVSAGFLLTRVIPITFHSIRHSKTADRFRSHAVP